ncbi:helix-turn-helix domain-containing protein [Flavobacterium sp. Sd200]|uniref:AraC family transcriptional regulator n=1 Tax=Flavobacterium sp. Sd200 TaxID=2692211 RepID=UPI00136CD6E6|nr:helix-turn-helix domain-containing protein [Flavobacterium sp. Sd200]MXN93132.1 helix-turn-helix domain-containing protein [Flavobacterium sp. Sd200]
MKKVNVLDISQFHDHDSAEDFYANTLEDHLITRHKDIALPHSHNFYLAILFTQGSGIHEIDFTAYEVKPGALFFLNPGQTHHWVLSEDTKGYIFFHTRNFYELQYTKSILSQYPFYYSMHSEPCIYLKNNSLDNFTAFFKSIFKENHSVNRFKEQALGNLVSLVYIEATRLFDIDNNRLTQSNNNYYTKFRKLEELLELHYREEKSPAVYASKLAMTPKHLNRITQAVTGKTITDVIMDRVLLEAKKEMILQKGSLNQIAEALGYNDYAYFSRIFKNKTGETPTDFLYRYIQNKTH